MAATTLRKTNTFWRKVTTQEAYFKWFLLMPLILVLILFMLYPIIYNIYYSFTNYTMRGKAEFVGFTNYRAVLRDLKFWVAIGRTAFLTVFCIIIEVVLGMAIALLLNKDFKGQHIIRGLCLLPLMISPLAMSMMWNFILQYDFGLVNQFLAMLGIKRIMWWSSSRAVFTIAFISIWQWLPFSVFVLLAGLKGLPKDAFEAARVDRASSWFTFRKLTLPLLKPLIMIIVLLRSMWLIRLYDPLYGTTHGGVNTETLDWYTYRTAFVYFDIGQAAAVAIVSLVITEIICNFIFKALIKALSGETK
jgi:multiple sugar transport system permease protein